MYNPNNELKAEQETEDQLTATKGWSSSKTFHPATRRIRQIDDKSPFCIRETALDNGFGNPSDAENIKNKKLK